MAPESLLTLSSVAPGLYPGQRRQKACWYIIRSQINPQAHKYQCSFLKDRYGKPERGSEWALIKILFEGDGNSNKTNTASNTGLRLTTQVGQIHVATEVLLNLGTNFQPYRPENVAEHQTSSPLTSIGQTGEHHRSDRSLLVKLDDFYRKASHQSVW
jgi:hypothetical protein